MGLNLRLGVLALLPPLLVTVYVFAAYAGGWEFRHPFAPAVVGLTGLGLSLFGAIHGDWQPPRHTFLLLLCAFLTAIFLSLVGWGWAACESGDCLV
jgi:hypothetical protein